MLERQRLQTADITKEAFVWHLVRGKTKKKFSYKIKEKQLNLHCWHKVVQRISGLSILHKDLKSVLRSSCQSIVSLNCIFHILAKQKKCVTLLLSSKEKKKEGNKTIGLLSKPSLSSQLEEKKSKYIKEENNRTSIISIMFINYNKILGLSVLAKKIEKKCELGLFVRMVGQKVLYTVGANCISHFFSKKKIYSRIIITEKRSNFATSKKKEGTKQKVILLLNMTIEQFRFH